MAQTRPYVIVVGTDYSELSHLALERALELAVEKAPAEVHLIHVLPAYRAAFSAEAAVSAHSVQLLEIKEAAAQLSAYAERSLARRKEQGKPAPARLVTHVRLDMPAAEVAQLASDLEADLVVIGTHGRRGFTRFLMGSVAEATVRLAPCPVLVVRPKSLPEPLPAVEPPCPRCLEVRKASQGGELWCEQHRQRHGQRHTYHQSDRGAADTNLPLFFRS